MTLQWGFWVGEGFVEGEERANNPVWKQPSAYIGGLHSVTAPNNVHINLITSYISVTNRGQIVERGVHKECTTQT